MKEVSREARPSLVDAAWAADRLGEPEQAIYRMCRQGTLPHVRLGRRIKFDPRAIEEFIANGGQGLPGGWRMDPDGGGAA